MVQARLSRIYDPGTSAAELAILLAEHYQGVPVAGWLASALLREGSSLARLQDAAKLMLSSQEAPSLTALTFAAAMAGAAGDAGEERRLIDQALAAVGVGDPDVRLEVVDFISTSGHAAEAVELLELRLKEAPDDDFAGDLYGAAIERAYATACADETTARERAACTGSPTARALVALRDAVSAFLDGTELGEAVRARVTEELSVTDDVAWSPEDRDAFGKLAEETPGSPWTPGRTRTRRRTISATCWPMTIPQASRCRRSRPTCRHRRRWRPVPWPGTNTSTTAYSGSMIRSRGRACGASISSPAPGGTSSSPLRQPPDCRDGVHR